MTILFRVKPFAKIVVIVKSLVAKSQLYEVIRSHGYPSTYNPPSKSRDECFERPLELRNPTQVCFC
jgi:hypothetical protein